MNNKIGLFQSICSKRVLHKGNVRYVQGLEPGLTRIIWFLIGPTKKWPCEKASAQDEHFKSSREVMHEPPIEIRGQAGQCQSSVFKQKMDQLWILRFIA